MKYFHTSLHLDVGDIELADVHTLEDSTGRWPVVNLGDNTLSIMPARRSDLAATLRRLADRVDAVLAANDIGDELGAVA
jgi:hypothetical protein